MPRNLKPYTLSGKQETEYLLGDMPGQRLELLQTVLSGMPYGYYLDVARCSKKEGTSLLQRRIEMLRQRGLDVGRGNAQYGFEIVPTPSAKDIREWELRIFRRR